MNHSLQERHRGFAVSHISHDTKAATVNLFALQQAIARYAEERGFGQMFQ